MKSRTLILLSLVSLFVIGCGSEKKVDDSKPAPKPQFKMIPSQKSGQ